MGEGIGIIANLAAGKYIRRLVAPGQRAHLRVRGDGPRVIDVRRVLDDAARRGLFARAAAGGPDAE